MFARIATVFTFLSFALPLTCASAIAVRGGGGGSPGGNTTVSQCNTGKLNCCNSVQSASSKAVTSVVGLLGLVLHDVTAQIGLTCNPISVIGGGGNSCSAQPVCCTGDSFKGGLIVIGCSPININL